MPTHLAFLRAINLGASRRFPKDAIIASAERAGFTDVATHINTGNVRVVSTLRSRAKVESALEEAFEADRGFPVPTIVLTPSELRAVVADADELAAEMGADGLHHVSLLKETPPDEVRRAAEEASTDAERLVVRGRAVHLLMAAGEGYHTARLSNAWVEKRMGVATNRNARVLRDIAATWC